MKRYSYLFFLAMVIWLPLRASEDGSQSMTQEEALSRMQACLAHVAEPKKKGNFSINKHSEEYKKLDEIETKKILGVLVKAAPQAVEMLYSLLLQSQLPRYDVMPCNRTVTLSLKP